METGANLIQIDPPQGNNQAGDRDDNADYDLEGAAASDDDFSYKINDLENVGCLRPRKGWPLVTHPNSHA